MVSTKLVLCYTCDRKYKGVRLVHRLSESDPDDRRCAHCGSNYADAMERGLASAFNALGEDELREDIIKRMPAQFQDMARDIIARRGNGRRGMS